MLPDANILDLFFVESRCMAGITFNNFALSIESTFCKAAFKCEFIVTESNSSVASSI
tara:strand:+ start:1600 stop:1770 length:171 start_codon:yes stop_codon:yes gene_type:complete